MSIFTYTLTAIIRAKFHSTNTHYRKHIHRKNGNEAVKINTSPRHTTMWFLVERSAAHLKLPTRCACVCACPMTFSVAVKLCRYHGQQDDIHLGKNVTTSRGLPSSSAPNYFWILSRESSCNTFWAAETELRKDKLQVHHLM